MVSRLEHSGLSGLSNSILDARHASKKDKRHSEALGGTAKRGAEGAVVLHVELWRLPVERHAAHQRD